MYQKFFTKTIESKFIKNILQNTPIPIYKIVKAGDYVFEGSIYIYNERVIKIKKAGIIGSEDESTRASYRTITRYYFGTNYPGYTECHISKYGYYDSETHEFLGKYLRCLNGLYNINLMPLYNCYSNRIATNFYIQNETATESYASLILPADEEQWEYDETQGLYYYEWRLLNGIQAGLLYELNKVSEITKYEVINDKLINLYRLAIPSENIKIELGHKMPSYKLINEPKSDYKLMQVPIKLNQTYTIALDTTAEILLKPAFIKNDHLVSIYDKNKNNIDLTDVLNQPVIIKQGAKFKKPFTYKLTMTNDHKYAKLLESNERNLYLLIQLPINFVTSLVILEGDYTENGNCVHHYDLEEFKADNISQATLNKFFRSNLSLLKINDKNIYAFSDALLNYLTLHAICPLDQVDKNMVRAYWHNYELRNWDKMGRATKTWTDDLRRYYYNQMMENTKIEHYDLLGYIDKNTEKYCLTDDIYYESDLDEELED